MIPLSDRGTPRRTTPYITYLLIVSNLAIFVWTLTMPAGRQQAFYAQWAAVPREVATLQPHALLTLLTCTYLHASWMHVLGNMLYLWIFGDNVEDAMGHARFLVFYTACGVGGSVAQTLMFVHSGVPLVGASGAIAGVLAAYMLLFPHGAVRTLVVIVPPFFLLPTLPAWLLIGVWIASQFWSGMTSLAGAGASVAYFAHIGGFAMGLLLARAFQQPHGAEQHLRRIGGHGYRDSWSSGAWGGGSSPWDDSRR